MITCDDPSDEMHISGCAFPIMNIDLQATVFNLFTQHEQLITNKIRLTFFQARKVRQIIQKRYAMNLILKSEGKTVRVQAELSGGTKVPAPKHTRRVQPRLTRSMSVGQIQRKSGVNSRTLDRRERPVIEPTLRSERLKIFGAPDTTEVDIETEQ